MDNSTSALAFEILLYHKEAKELNTINRILISQENYFKHVSNTMGSEAGDTERGSQFTKCFAFADFFFETVTNPSESDN